MNYGYIENKDIKDNIETEIEFKIKKVIKQKISFLKTQNGLFYIKHIKEFVNYT